MSSVPVVPPLGLKAVGQYLKVAAEHETRDVVVAYWARFWSVQRSLVLDRSSDESKSFIVGLLGWLEKRKSELRDNEAITNEHVAEAHLENYAIKLFKWADEQDRNGAYNKNVVKAYYTSSLLIDVLENFVEAGGALGDEFERMRKYGRWRAAHIHSSLKNGEQPEPPPKADEDGDDHEESAAAEDEEGHFSAGAGGAAAAAAYVPAPVAAPAAVPQSSSSSVSLGVDAISRAQKYCKWAGSALNFDDVPTAIENLEKALSLLRTGVE